MRADFRPLDHRLQTHRARRTHRPQGHRPTPIALRKHPDDQDGEPPHRPKQSTENDPKPKPVESLANRGADEPTNDSDNNPFHDDSITHRAPNGGDFAGSAGLDGAAAGRGRLGKRGDASTFASVHRAMTYRAGRGKACLRPPEGGILVGTRGRASHRFCALRNRLPLTKPRKFQHRATCSARCAVLARFLCT